MINKSFYTQRKIKLIISIFLCVTAISTTTGCHQWYTAYEINKGQLRSREILPNLIQALDDPKPRTRRAALQRISRLKLSAQEAIPKVVILAKTDDDEDTRHYAIKVLRLIMPNSPENLKIMEDVAICNSGDLAIEAENTSNSIKRKSSANKLAIAGKINMPDGIEIKLTPEFIFFNGYVTIYPSRSAYMLPIEIYINNQTDAPIKLNSENFTLSDPEGKQRTQLSVTAAIKRQQYDIGAAVLRGIVILGPIPVSKAARANGIISKFCEAKVLTTIEVQPGAQVKKAIFFDCPSRPIQISDWQLDFSYTQKDCNKRTHIHYIFGTGEEITTEDTTSQPHLTNHSPSPTTLEIKLLELNHLKEKKLITEEEYIEKRESLINKF
ncbi:hypothetical protein HRM2_p00680 (plasmid) [Desulforapulum autotrophicum HRM2]|uniref:SHOCT domain-containing protein n=1 Tax=Desulforapulum autotrophicum (strain ATCC 43914 / DSM 3382 / VKM B-1955 / HRM2) TaxID=177437 RepID=C0QMR8_DESAH|nr:HEAT repeat domain-containing protein [Desulforapulum autotrophicum]ACN18062.1 hypothetical protein HRM2_p00680 [Desulforapulum autotrophicum HRM2]